MTFAKTYLQTRPCILGSMARREALTGGALALPWLSSRPKRAAAEPLELYKPQDHYEHEREDEAHAKARPSPPKAAVAAGYTHPVLIDGFSQTSAASTMLGVYNWYPFQPYGAPVLDPSQYRVKNGVLVIDTDASGYGSGLTSINSLEPAVSRPGALARNTGKGLVFQFGYFECRMKYANDRSPRTAKGHSWPAFWTNSIEGPRNKAKTYTELDFVEAYPVAAEPYISIACTLHEWTRGWNADGTPNGKNGDQFNHTNTIGTPLIFTQNDFNVYGCLWTPKAVRWFINNHPTIQLEIGPGTLYPTAVRDPMYLVLGTGKDWPVTFDWVHVWQ